MFGCSLGKQHYCFKILRIFTQFCNSESVNKYIFRIITDYKSVIDEKKKDDGNLKIKETERR